MKFKTKTKVALVLCGLFLLMIVLAQFSAWVEERNNAELARAMAIKTREGFKMQQAKAEAAKPAAIANALARLSSDPEAGLKLLEWYRNDPDPITKNAFEQLNTAVKKKHLAKAIEYLKANEPEQADNELLAYQGPTQSADVKAIMGDVAKAVAIQTAAREKRLLGQKKKEGVKMGMTREAALLSSWGRPERVNRSTGAYGVNEQWVYPGHHNYLYFENGILTSIQN